VTDANDRDLARLVNLRDDKPCLVRLKSGGQLYTHRVILRKGENLKVAPRGVFMFHRLVVFRRGVLFPAQRESGSSP